MGREYFSKHVSWIESDAQTPVPQGVAGFKPLKAFPGFEIKWTMDNRGIIFSSSSLPTLGVIIPQNPIPKEAWNLEVDTLNTSSEIHQWGQPSKSKPLKITIPPGYVIKEVKSSLHYVHGKIDPPLRLVILLLVIYLLIYYWHASFGVTPKKAHASGKSKPT